MKQDLPFKHLLIKKVIPCMLVVGLCLSICFQIFIFLFYSSDAFAETVRSATDDGVGYLRQLLADATAPPILSIVILTYHKPESLWLLIESLSQQIVDLDALVDIIVADIGCLGETRDVSTASVSCAYVSFCDSPGYAVGKNRVIMEGWVNTKTKWILFLDDSAAIHSKFIQSMLEMAESKPKAGAVGCMILNDKGDQIFEAGGIVWSDGTSSPYGNGQKDIDSPSLHYARPVDYVSGACLMIQLSIFKSYQGFQHHLFSDNYKEVDLQMHLQHELHKEVWLQPLAKLNHNNHGSFDASESGSLITTSVEDFKIKWQNSLSRAHLPTPKTTLTKTVYFERGRDLRIRNKNQANIMYIDERIPNPSQGSGYGRAHDNLMMLTELGHFVTVKVNDDPGDWCDDLCLQYLEIQLGIEVFGPFHGTLQSILLSRIGFYDIVIVSRRASVSVWETLIFFNRISPFVLVYDINQLEFRGDRSFLSISKKHRSMFPGGDYTSYLVSQDVIQKSVSLSKRWEMELLKLADIIITDSYEDTPAVYALKECINDSSLKDEGKDCPVYSVGFSMDTLLQTEASFETRKGILFVGAFHSKMYHNGDAVWFFVKEIFPSIVNECKGTIPLTIAGRKIPKLLREYVEQNPVISGHVLFIESPPDLRALYNRNRVVLAPHLYGTGIQYKVIEALTMGVPVVMSQVVAENFGISSRDEMGCIADDQASFRKCVLQMYSDLEKWQRSRMNGLEFIKKTHNRGTVLSTWSMLITDAMRRRVSLAVCDPVGCSEREGNSFCEYGEADYASEYPDYGTAVQMGDWALAWDHFDKFARMGETFTCCAVICNGGMCDQGEARYKAQYPDVAGAIASGALDSAWQHFVGNGMKEGRAYVCELPLYLPTSLCELDLNIFGRELSSDVDLLPSVRRMLSLHWRKCRVPG